MEAEERPSKKRRLSSDVEAHDISGLSNPHNNDSTFKTMNGAGDETKDQSKVSTNADEALNEGAGSLESSTNNKVPASTETAPLADAISNPQDQPLSKSQQKKLRKKQEWESKRDERKAIRKEKQIAKRERRREERKQQHQQHQERIAQGLEPPPPEKKVKVTQKRAVTLPVTILIDCDFDDLMKDNERISLAAQVTRCYSDNKKAPFRAHLAVCSFGGKLKERFETILTHYKGWRGMRFLECPFGEAAEQAREWMGDEKYGGSFAGAFEGVIGEDVSKFDPTGEEKDNYSKAVAKLKEEGEVVYLSSESPATLTTLKPYSTYIIGGLVDKNREKGICYKRAVQAGVKTAKLPIGEFMEMQSRKVLTTNHVNEICLKWLECGDWGKAFMTAIPKRKGGKLKDDDTEGSKSKEAGVVNEDDEDFDVDDLDALLDQSDHGDDAAQEAMTAPEVDGLRHTNGGANENVDADTD